ncbi:hypothetical protein HaLaN_20994 [Haematococcus lacustris]|uniref:Uncharacterized protein n=1 Tax=Haematococcus lacustris TaxID=44745 RepID=A0A699ZUU8_HAELA|nr:hypothetical protein HaLaN_20994 [Haematococcus lacustris]
MACCCRWHCPLLTVLCSLTLTLLAADYHLALPDPGSIPASSGTGTVSAGRARQWPEVPSSSSCRLLRLMMPTVSRALHPKHRHPAAPPPHPLGCSRNG